MHTKNKTVYASPYKMLQGRGMRAYQAQGTEQDYTEADCDPADLTVTKGVALWGAGQARMIVRGLKSYADIKTRLIKIRYSNDDQLAIILNDDDTEMRRMQAWRAWAADVARRIADKLRLG